MAYISERRRTEFVVICELLKNPCLAMIKEKSDVENMTYIVQQLDTAITLLISDVDYKTRQRFAKRAMREMSEALNPLNGRVIMSVFLIIAYWITELIQSERYGIIEGSPFDRAQKRLLEILGDPKRDALWSDLEKSARKGAVRLNKHFQEKGYFCKTLEDQDLLEEYN